MYIFLFFIFNIIIIIFTILFQKYMPRRKSGEEMNFTYVECLLYTFHNLALKVSNLTNVYFLFYMMNSVN